MSTSSPSVDKQHHIDSGLYVAPTSSIIVDGVHAQQKSVILTTPWHFKRFLNRQPDTADIAAVDPRDWPRSGKYIILLITTLTGMTATGAMAIYYPAIEGMQDYFGTGETTMNASVAIFVFFLAIFPVMWATFSDRHGRRPIYGISLLIAVVGNICCAVSINAAMFIVFRAISAVGSAAVQSIGAGTTSDIFGTHERARAYAIFTLGPLLGPVLGPIFGGYLNQMFGWRSIFWFLSIVCFILWLVNVILLPETMLTAPAAAAAPLQEVVSASEKDALPGGGAPPQPQYKNPLAAMSLMRHPNIALAVLMHGVLFFAMYLLNASFTRIYSNQYGFNSAIVGVFYFPIAGGFAIGSLIGGHLCDRRYVRLMAQLPDTTPPRPELRIGGFLIYGCMVGLLLAYTTFGWCVQMDLHYGLGLVATGIVGFCVGPPFTVMSAYSLDCYRERSASVSACSSFARYFLGGIGILISSAVSNLLGPGVLYTICGALVLLSSLTFIAIKVKGEAWRSKKKM